LPSLFSGVFDTALTPTCLAREKNFIICRVDSDNSFGG
jgi:hypothetical protein